MTTRTGFIASVVGWLRAGYPEGVPQRDYLPLFALLASKLSHDELRAVAIALEESADPSSAAAIRAAIEVVTNVPASDADIANVRAHLSAVGDWPEPGAISRSGAARRGASSRTARTVDGSD